MNDKPAIQLQVMSENVRRFLNVTCAFYFMAKRRAGDFSPRPEIKTPR